MAHISRSALVMYSCEQMFDLVNNLTQYPEFIPNCADAKKHEISNNEVHGSLLIKKAGISAWFTTKNNIINGQVIDMKLIDGPFKYLTGTWKFIHLDDQACKVELNVEFKFASKILENTLGKLFNHFIGSLVTAFTQRAKIIYG